MSEIQNHNTIFDDVFRTMVQKMPKLLIPLINEVFCTDYSENESFRQIRNEHEEEFGKIITDSIILIRDKTYHIECQSRLEKELFKDNQSVLYADLVNLIQKISDYILREEEMIKEGVDDAMGGKVLELESERLFRIGKAEGKAEGEFNLGRLISLLFEAGRLEDVELAAKDEEIRKKFYKEFGIID